MIFILFPLNILCILTLILVFVGELLQKFFSFYWNFDFTRNIVCIRTGKAQPIEEMVNSHLKDDFQVNNLRFVYCPTQI